MWRSAGCLGLSVGLLLIVAACGPSTPRPAGGPVVTISEQDFRLDVAPPQVPAGWVTLQVSNAGPSTHEVLIVATTEPDGRLVLRPDGVTVDEDALDSHKVGSVDGLLPGTHRTLRLRLSAGRYELFCNMAGHYLTGMHTGLTVTPSQ